MFLFPQSDDIAGGLPQGIGFEGWEIYILAKGYFSAKVISRHEDEKMSNDFENSQEYRKVLEIAKKQEEIYKNVTKAIFPEALAKFQELSGKLNEWKNSLDNMPGLLKLAEVLQNYEQEVRKTEGLTEAEFEEKYRTEIEWSEKFGKNGWVISEHSNPADIKKWEQLLGGGEAKVAEFFDGEDIVILDVIIEGLQGKYISDEIRLYFKNGMQAFENEEYMTAAMYLLALLDNRVNKLVDFPNQRMSYKVKYSKEGFTNQKEEDFRKLTEKRRFMSKKIYFLEMYPSLIAYLNRIFIDGSYKFENGIEPPYLNRNWLMHGRMNRRVERYECIQILNALSVMEFMFGEK